MQTYFPGISENAEESFLVRNTKKETDLILASILNEEVSEQLETIQMQLTPEPVVYGGPQGEEVKTDKQFEENKNLLSQYLAYEIDAEKITVFQYFSKIETIKKNKPKNERANY